MLMHSCCSILFIGMTGFDPNAKRIQKSFENEFGKPIWRWPNYSRLARLPCLLPFLLPLSGPAQTAEATTATSPLFLSPVDSLGPPVSAFSFFSRPTWSRAKLLPCAHILSHGSAPHAPDSIKGSSDLSPLPLLPRRSSSPLS
jgi:hypothetical protein